MPGPSSQLDLVRIRFGQPQDDLGPNDTVPYDEVSQFNPLPVKMVGPEGADSPGDFAFNYFNIASQATFVIKSGQGYLHALVFNTPVATAVITLYDDLQVNASKVIGTITVVASPQHFQLLYDVQFQKGLTIVQGTATSNITVSYI